MASRSNLRPGERITTPWSEVDTRPVHDFYGFPVGTVAVECATYETADGACHRNGVYRVRTTGAVRRTKKFIGEVAWSDANRFANDLVDELENLSRATA